MAVANASVATKARVEKFNKNKSLRQLEVGDKVLLRIPGLCVSLEASCRGPYDVQEKFSRVNYRVCKDGRKKNKVVHINNTKRFKARGVSVNAVCVVAEENKEMSDMWDKKCVLADEKCEDYCEESLQRVLGRLMDYFSESPGLCTVRKCVIEVKDGSEVEVPVHIRGAVDEEIQKLVHSGIIVESSAEWCSPVVPVRKKDGGIRLCIDFRELNKITPLRRYWFPSLSKILDKVGKSAVLSKLDLTAGFHQIILDESSQDLTSFVCPAGRFKFVRMPFGLKNAPAVFQSVLELVLRPVADFSSNYIDDVIVFSGSWDDHLVDVK